MNQCKKGKLARCICSTASMERMTANSSSEGSDEGICLNDTPGTPGMPADRKAGVFWLASLQIHAPPVVLNAVNHLMSGIEVDSARSSNPAYAERLPVGPHAVQFINYLQVNYQYTDREDFPRDFWPNVLRKYLDSLPDLQLQDLLEKLEASAVEPISLVEELQGHRFRLLYLVSRMLHKRKACRDLEKLLQNNGFLSSSDASSSRDHEPSRRQSAKRRRKSS